MFSCQFTGNWWQWFSSSSKKWALKCWSLASSRSFFSPCTICTYLTFLTKCSNTFLPPESAIINIIIEAAWKLIWLMDHEWLMVTHKWWIVLISSLKIFFFSSKYDSGSPALILRPSVLQLPFIITFVKIWALDVFLLTVCSRSPQLIKLSVWWFWACRDNQIKPIPHM